MSEGLREVEAACKLFGGTQKVFAHHSSTLTSEMQFTVFFPPQHVRFLLP